MASSKDVHLAHVVAELASATELTLVDNESLEPSISEDAHEDGLELRRLERVEQGKLATAALATLTLSAVNLERGQQTVSYTHLAMISATSATMRVVICSSRLSSW